MNYRGVKPPKYKKKVSCNYIISILMVLVKNKGKYMKEEYIVATLKKTYSHIDLREFADNFYIFKDEYDRVRNLPSITTHNKMDLILEWKDFIYSLDNGRELYRKDKMWEALNDDITKEELDRFVRGVYYGR